MVATKKSVKKSNVKKGACKCGCGRATCSCGGKKGTCKCVCHAGDSVKYTNMFAAYRAFWRRGFAEWRGTSSRSEYWWAWLGNILVCLLFLILRVSALLLDSIMFEEFAVFTLIVSSLFILYVIAAIVPAVSMLTRRMHDAGLTAWFWLLYFINFAPFVGSYLWSACVLVIALLPTQITNNPYHKFNK